MAQEFNFVKNKAFIFGNHPETFASEKQLIKDICTLNGLLDCREIAHVDSHINYDLFFAKIRDGEIAVKLTLDKEHSLNKEFSILEKNINRLICPYPIACGSLNKVHYSLLGKLPFENLDENGRGQICQSEHAIPNFMANLSTFQAPKDLPNIFSYLKDFLDFDIYRIPEVQVEWIENHVKVKELIKEQVFYLQQKIKDSINKINFNQTDFCHGNLISRNILCNDEFLCAINFESAYWGDLCLEFALLKHEMFYDLYQDRVLYSKFCELSGKSFDAERYFVYQEFSAYLSLLKTLINYLTEVYVLKCHRENLVTQNIIKFIKNYNSFTILPDFQQKLKPIADFFIESVK